MKFIDPSDEAAKKPFLVRISIICVRIVATVLVTIAAFFVLVVVLIFLANGCSESQRTSPSEHTEPQDEPTFQHSQTGVRIIVVKRIESAMEYLNRQGPRPAIRRPATTNQNDEKPSQPDAISPARPGTPSVSGNGYWAITTTDRVYRATTNIAQQLQIGRRYRVVVEKPRSYSSRSSSPFFPKTLAVRGFRPPKFQRVAPAARALEEQRRRQIEAIKSRAPGAQPRGSNAFNAFRRLNLGDKPSIARVMEDVDQKVVQKLDEFYLSNVNRFGIDNLGHYSDLRRSMRSIADKVVAGPGRTTATGHSTVLMPDDYALVALSLGISNFILENGNQIDNPDPDISFTVQRYKQIADQLTAATGRNMDLPSHPNQNGDPELGKVIGKAATLYHQVKDCLVRLKNMPKPSSSLDSLGSMFRNSPTVDVDEKQKKVLLKAFVDEWVNILKKGAEGEELVKKLQEIARRYAAPITKPTAFTIEFKPAHKETDELDTLIIINGSRTLIDATVVVEMSDDKGNIVRNVSFASVLPANRRMLTQYGHGITLGKETYEIHSLPKVKEINVTVYSPSYSTTLHTIPHPKVVPKIP